jgi:HD-GYP domain-containing protein (c-di-GMP phosphodiesterase class II)
MMETLAVPTSALEGRIHFSTNALPMFGAELESRGLEPQGHTLRLVRLTESLGTTMRLPPNSLEALVQAAYLHDVGKLVLPEKILLKPGALDPSEWDVVKTHSRWGATLAGAITGLNPRTVGAIMHHHERWDGSGYPARLQGEEIPIESRILAVCDVYDTLLSKRAYGRAWSVQSTLEELQTRNGTHFDPRVLDAFLDRALGKLTISE